MRNLNSLILEGILASDPLYTPGTSNAPDVTRFLLDAGPDVPAMPVIAYGRLAATVRDNLRTGSAIRIVGRLGIDASLDAMTPVVIVAEHIEIRTVRSAEARAYAEEAAS